MISMVLRINCTVYSWTLSWKLTLNTMTKLKHEQMGIAQRYKTIFVLNS